MAAVFPCHPLVPSVERAGGVTNTGQLVTPSRRYLQRRGTPEMGEEVFSTSYPE